MERVYVWKEDSNVNYIKVGFRDDEIYVVNIVRFINGNEVQNKFRIFDRKIQINDNEPIRINAKTYNKVMKAFKEKIENITNADEIKKVAEEIIEFVSTYSEAET